MPPVQGARPAGRGDRRLTRLVSNHRRHSGRDGKTAFWRRSSCATHRREPFRPPRPVQIPDARKRVATERRAVKDVLVMYAQLRYSIGMGLVADAASKSGAGPDSIRRPLMAACGRTKRRPALSDGWQNNNQRLAAAISRSSRSTPATWGKIPAGFPVTGHAAASPWRAYRFTPYRHRSPAPIQHFRPAANPPATCR